MRAQHMTKPVERFWPAGMNMRVPVCVTRAAVAYLLVAHDAQDARRIRLQHINNNHPNATAKKSQIFTLIAQGGAFFALPLAHYADTNGPGWGSPAGVSGDPCSASDS